MRAYLNDNYGFPQQSLKPEERKILSSTTDCRKDSTELDNRLGHILQCMEHLMHAVYPDTENIL